MHINQKFATGARRIAIAALLLGICSFGSAQNVENQIIASQFGQFKLYGTQGSYNFLPAACQLSAGNKNFNAFTQGVPVRVVDMGSPSLSETVIAGPVSIQTCAVVLPVAHYHSAFYLTSGTAGLQEALNANGPGSGPNTIILDNTWYALGGDGSIISSVKGYSNLGLVDITQTPYVWYSWNGSQYVEVTPTGGDVTSVFGRTGAVTAQTGDYTCSQVTNCGLPANSYLLTTLSGGISSSATTIPLTSVTGLTTTGEIVIGGEWISYTGISGDSLTGATRGIHQTTPEAYSSGTGILSVIMDFTNPSQSVFNFVVSTEGSNPATPVFGCGSESSGTPQLAQFGCPGSNWTYIDTDGAINQTNGSAYGGNVFYAPMGIGPGGGEAQITNSGYLFDTTRQNQSTVPQGFGAGLAGPVASIQPLTITAPSIINFAQPSGTTTWSYECTGTDVDGNTFPGTVASVANGPATMTGGEMIAYCPFSAGAASESLWRTAGGPNQGLLVTTYAPNPATAEDNGGAATPGTPPSTNSSIPKVCVGTGEVSCWITTASAPTGSCTDGWFDTNQSGSPATVYQCVGTAWEPVGLPTLSGTTTSLGGSALSAGACASTTVTITGLTASMDVHATPSTYPGDGYWWEAYASAAGTATVKVCAAVSGTPTTSLYNLRVTQ